MYNLRYHIASLVGVFLALALGLVLGGLVVESGGLEGQREALVDGLRKEFATLRSENAQLTTDNTVLTAFSADMTDLWVTDRLRDRAVVVLVPAGRSDGLAASTAAIESAGGRAAVVAVNDADLGLKDEALRSGVTSATGDVATVKASVIASLVAEWSAPAAARPVTDALVEGGVITVEGFDAQTAASGLVTVPATDEGLAGLEVAIAQAFTKAGTPTAAAQMAKAKSEFAAQAADAGVGSFDTLGTDVGRYTLVALMTGAKPAYYGTGDQAVAGYPDPAGL